MSMNTVAKAGEKGKDAMLEQLEAIREALSDIEAKLIPAPAEIPNTFEQAKVWAGAHRDLCNHFRKGCDDFWANVDFFLVRLDGITRNIPARANQEAWARTLRKLERTFIEQARNIHGQLMSLADFSEYTAMMAALACDCDLDAMQKAVDDDASLYCMGRRIDPREQRGHTQAEAVQRT